MDGIAQRIPILCESFSDRFHTPFTRSASGLNAGDDGEGTLYKAALVSTVTSLVKVGATFVGG